MEFDKKSSWISFTVQAFLEIDGRLTDSREFKQQQQRGQQERQKK